MLLRTIARRSFLHSKSLKLNRTRANPAQTKTSCYAKSFSYFYPSISSLHCSCACRYDNSVDDSGNATESTDHANLSWSEIRTSQSGSSIAKKGGVLSLDEVVELLREEGAEDIVVIKIPEKMCYVTYFIVATALSPRHLGSVAEMTNKFYKQKRKKGQPFAVIEGKRAADDWQCLDLGDMVIHIMLEGTREKYNLEKLWLLGREYDDLLHEAPSDDEIIRNLSMEGLNLMSMDENTVKALGNLDFSNPWLDENEEFNQDDDFAEDILKFDVRSEVDKDDELGDDDAFLV